MALRNSNKPAFESMEGSETATATAERPAPFDNSGTGAEVAPAPAPKSTAVAAPKSTAVAVAAPTTMKFQAALANLENVINPTDATFGTFQKITAAAGGSFMLEGEQAMGEEVVLEVISWNRRWVASPGSNDEEASKLAKFSIDGVHIDGDDILLIDYVRFLRETHHYEDAKVKEYFAIWGEMVSSSKSGPVEPAERHIYELQCSPETVKKFNGWRMEHGMKVARGIFTDSNVVRCKCNTGKNGKNLYGYATFASVV